MWEFTQELKNLEKLKRSQAKLNSMISKEISKEIKSDTKIEELKEERRNVIIQIKEKSSILESIEKLLHKEKELSAGIAFVSFVFKKDRDDFIEIF